MKKFLSLFITFLATTTFLVGCSSNLVEPVEPKAPGLEDVKVFTETLDNSIQLDIYRLGVGKVTEEYAKSMKDVTVGDPIVAVKYVLTNKGEAPVDIRNITLWNASFKNTDNAVTSFNFNDISLHGDLGTDTLPKEFVSSTSEKWLLEANQTATFAYDFKIDNSDMVISVNVIFPNNPKFYYVEVDLNSK